jgi:hypothetical protein
LQPLILGRNVCRQLHVLQHHDARGNDDLVKCVALLGIEQDRGGLLEEVEGLHGAS